MKNLVENMKEKQAFSVLTKIFFVLLDIVFINLSSFLALWLRFNMEMSRIDPQYMASVVESMPINTIITPCPKAKINNIKAA